VKHLLHGLSRVRPEAAPPRMTVIVIVTACRDRLTKTVEAPAAAGRPRHHHLSPPDRKTSLLHQVPKRSQRFV
jgi:hypothetical protein